MAYALEVSKILADTLRKLATLNPHQLAGHVANLDFWLGEVKHGTQLLDDYHKRFETMKSAQTKAAKERRTIEFTLDDDRFTSGPVVPRSVPHAQLKSARFELMEAAYGFLVRCYKSGLLDQDSLERAAQSIGTSIDSDDLVK